MPETTLIVVQRLTGPPPAIVGGKKGDNDRPRVAVGLPRRGGEVWTNGEESFPRDVSHNIICNTGCRTPASPHPRPTRWGTAHLHLTAQHNGGRQALWQWSSPDLSQGTILFTLKKTPFSFDIGMDAFITEKLFMILPYMFVHLYEQPSNATYRKCVCRAVRRNQCRRATPVPSFPAWPPMPCQQGAALTRRAALVNNSPSIIPLQTPIS